MLVEPTVTDKSTCIWSIAKLIGKGVVRNYVIKIFKKILTFPSSEKIYCSAMTTGQKLGDLHLLDSDIGLFAGTLGSMAASLKTLITERTGRPRAELATG